MSIPPPATTRAELLARVRAALERAGKHTPQPPPPPASTVRLVDAGPGLIETFADRAAASGIVVTRCDAADLERAITRLVHGAARSVISAIRDQRLRPIVEHAVTAAGASPAELGRAFDADMGISDVDAAVAETGSLVIASLPERPRASWLVPPVHVALVPATRIVPDPTDVWPGGAAADPPASLVLVSGPSKTADIEGVLVTGVHGPGVVHALVIPDL